MKLSQKAHHASGCKSPVLIKVGDATREVLSASVKTDKNCVNMTKIFEAILSYLTCVGRSEPWI